MAHLSAKFVVGVDWGKTWQLPEVFLTPQYQYKDHPIVNPPATDHPTQNEWVASPYGLLVRAELPVLTAQQPRLLGGPKTLTIGSDMRQRPSGLFAPKVKPWKTLNDFFGAPNVLNLQTLEASFQSIAQVASFTTTFDPLAVLNGYSVGSYTFSEPSITSALQSLVPALSTATSVCPAKGCERAHPKLLEYLIIHLNDDHRWTRESIADWLDTLDIDLTVQRKETPNADHRIRGAKFDQVIYDDILAFDPGAVPALT